jgi:hypothetical protein
LVFTPAVQVTTPAKEAVPAATVRAAPATFVVIYTPPTVASVEEM